VPRRKSWTAILAVLIVTIALTTATTVTIAPVADAATPLSGKLRIAKRALRQAHERLEAAEAALAAALAGATDSSATDSATTDSAATLSGQASALPVTAAETPTVDELKAKVAKASRAVRVWHRRVQRIARRVREQLRIAEWERHAKWMPIIEIAARKYHVKADGMYRMMMRESGGRRYAGADSAFKGLFQYWTGAWAASWNPWRHDSIYDGSSQIFATAYAIHKGWGAQFWTTTWASQY
jgi:hypothetical protein